MKVDENSEPSTEPAKVGAGFVQGTKVLCSLDLLMRVFVSKCQHLGWHTADKRGVHPVCYKCALEMDLSLGT